MYETEECFDDLKLADGSEVYKLPSSDTGYYPVDIQLPEDYTCERCVLRWHYNTGNLKNIYPHYKPMMHFIILTGKTKFNVRMHGKKISINV